MKMTATNIGVQMKSNSAISELEWKKARNPSNSSNPAVGLERPGSQRVTGSWSVW